MMSKEDIKRVRKNTPRTDDKLDRIVNSLHTSSYERQSKLDLLFGAVICFIVAGVLLYFVI